MNQNLNSPTTLTEFGPLQPEERQQSVGLLFSKLLKFGKNAFSGDAVPAESENATGPETQEPIKVSPVIESSESTSVESESYTVDVPEGRSLTNILKRISNLAFKNTNLQDYADTDLKQYWMPDSVSRECYECGEKFTTFRRRHHCRVCGQIFCSRCCNQEIPGKIIGCTGELRVCTYCCKIVLSYLQSPDASSILTAELKALQEDLQTKFGSRSSSDVSLAAGGAYSASTLDGNDNDSVRRKISVGYQEEKFALERNTNTNYLSAEECSHLLKNSVSLQNIYAEIRKPFTGVIPQIHRYQLRSYSDCILGSELVNWLIAQQKSNSRIQASAISQALLDAGYIESISETGPFYDGYALYKLQSLTSPDISSTPEFDTRLRDDPSWIYQITNECNITDSETEQISPPVSGKRGQLTSSSSSFLLDLNLKESTVHLSRPLFTVESPVDAEEPMEFQLSCPEMTEVKTSQQKELVPASGWHNAKQLRSENGEDVAYNTLTNAFAQHEQCYLSQLLNSEGLSLNWAEILTPVAHRIVDIVRPDVNHDALDLNICQYVQFKKVPGGLRTDTQIVGGIVCSKNVAHRGMVTKLENPKILLLKCALVYQRTEGRLMSLESVMMQEHEYLRHVTARIVALQPDLVLVHRNVSRLAQDLLRDQKVTLIMNVKLSILNRLSRCMQADLVTVMDAHLGRPRLGTCKRFYIKTFRNNNTSKTLMFFEGLPQPHLGATVLLCGAPKTELAKLKRVASDLLFACYNWRLEKSFLMDEFAQPSNSKADVFFDEGSSKETSPHLTETHTAEDEVFLKDNRNSKLESNDLKIKSNRSSSDENKLVAKSVSDFSDPLHSYPEHDSLKTGEQEVSLSEIPFFNKFRKALDDTILSVSPYLKFFVPYLETEQGKKCKLRQFFPEEIYYSKHFSVKSEISKNKEVEMQECKKEVRFEDVHPFVMVQIRNNVGSDEIQSLLAHFRACGGRLPHKEMDCEVRDDVRVDLRNLDNRIDVLDSCNHQRIAVLYYSFSPHSNNAPAFCVNPWIVLMDFYGQNDIPLGCFLERYCFRSTYTCPSDTCGQAMLHHIRRFVHNSGCISITLNSLDSQSVETDNDEIVMWSWCCLCQKVSPVVPMSTDTWSFSLAKYLELKFYGGMYNRRGTDGCQHSMHHDHIQYFGLRNMVATFKYNSVQDLIWEISLPPLLIEVVYDTAMHRNDVINELKILTPRGHDIFSIVTDRLATLPTDIEAVSQLKQQLQKEYGFFKTKIEEIQLLLTSEAMRSKSKDNGSQANMWYIEDCLSIIKRIVVETVETWNVRLNGIDEGLRRRDLDKRKDKQVAAPPFEEADQSEISSDSHNNQATPVTKKIKSLDNVESDFASDESIKGHQRSHSDATILVHLDNTSVVDGKKTDKKPVKNILSQLLQSSNSASMIQSPQGQNEHYLLPATSTIPLVVYEDEPSSIIAYALNTVEYKRAFEDLVSSKPQPMHQTPSPLPKHKSLGQLEKPENELMLSGEKSSGILSFLRTPTQGSAVASGDTSETEDNTPKDKPDDLKKAKPPHIRVQFQDSTCNFYCRVYYAERFAHFRELVMPSGEEAYVRSLSRSIQWNARGGKSGSCFHKTKDDRFIIKEMSKPEIQQFLESATNYFAYMDRCYASSVPTLLGKIVGVYQVAFRNNTTNATLKTNFLVIENLFYGRTVTHKFDLKGSDRNRLVNPNEQDGEIVLLDENLLKRSCESPLYIFPHSKAVLTAAIQRDTEFLASQSVMDYSLLVGLDSDSKELVLGIIDYIRTFTWDKKLETMVKKSGILGGQGKLPTVVSPGEYRSRFIGAMHKYFLEVPDRWTGLGSGLKK